MLERAAAIGNLDRAMGKGRAISGVGGADSATAGAGAAAASARAPPMGSVPEGSEAAVVEAQQEMEPEEQLLPPVRLLLAPSSAASPASPAAVGASAAQRAQRESGDSAASQDASFVKV